MCTIVILYVFSRFNEIGRIDRLTESRAGQEVDVRLIM